MYPISDREYLKICAQIARSMSISLASAKKKVEYKITQKGVKSIEHKREIAMELLNQCKRDNRSGQGSIKILDDLMESLGNEDNFMIED